MREPGVNKSDRVGLYLKPHTRNRLNVLKAKLGLQTGMVMSQDDAISHLLDHYDKTAPAQRQAAVELAR